MATTSRPSLTTRQKAKNRRALRKRLAKLERGRKGQHVRGDGEADYPTEAEGTQEAKKTKAKGSQEAKETKKAEEAVDIWAGHDQPIGLTELGLELTEVPIDQLEVEMASLQPYMPSQEEIERVCESIREDWPEKRLLKGGDV